MVKPLYLFFAFLAMLRGVVVVVDSVLVEFERQLVIWFVLIWLFLSSAVGVSVTASAR